MVESVYIVDNNFKFSNKTNNEQNSCNDGDIMQQIIGNFGRWQLRTIIIIFLCKIPVVWFMACIIFAMPIPKTNEYYCKPPEYTIDILNDSVKLMQLSHKIHKERNTDREFNINFCNIIEKSLNKNTFYSYFNNSNDVIEQLTSTLTSNETTANDNLPCKDIEHNIKYKTIVNKYNLICSKQLLASFTQCFHILGQFIGGFVSWKLNKYISPKTIMLYGMIILIPSGTSIGFIDNYELHVIFRFIASICCALMFNAGQIIFSDITAGKAKIIAIALSELFWSIGLISLPGIVFLVDSWTYLYIAISCPTIILIILHRWISESPHWLIRHGKFEETLQVLLESIAFNGKCIPLDIEIQLKIYAEKLKQSKNSNYWSIWNGKTKKIFIIAIHWAWIFSFILYNAMILNVRSFGMNHIHINTTIMGFSEMIGVFIGLFLIFYTRRYWFWSGCLIIIAGILTFFIWAIPNTLNENHRIGFSMIFCIGLKIANAATLTVLVICTEKVIANNEKRLLMFSVSMWSKLFLLIAPFIVATSLLHSLIPITVFGVLAVKTGLFMCYLNTQFWSSDQPRIEKVPSLRTFRRNSADILAKRNSACVQFPSTTNENDIPTTDSHSKI